MGTLEIKRREDKLYLHYCPISGETNWIKKEMGKYRIRNVFLIPSNERKIFFRGECVEIQLAILNQDTAYYQFDKEILGINYDLFIHKEYEFNLETFLQENYYKPISIFREIGKVNDSNTSLYIGGKAEESMPIELFKEMIRKFPNSYELQLYKKARIEQIIGNYFLNEKSYDEKYQKYLKKKEGYIYKKEVLYNIDTIDSKLVLERVKFLRDTLKEMLESGPYPEHIWQKFILTVIKFLYPKYILILEGVEAEDPYYDPSSSARSNIRKIDLALLDVDGSLDLIEIKVPEKKILSPKREYRNNFYPLKELSGGIMQLEKYIFYLNKGGVLLEKKLYKKYKSLLPKGLQIKITNPQGIIVAGRSVDWTDRQKRDFEVIRRKYKNIFEILTYDDLLERLSNLFEALKKQA